jgi:lipoate-protein ligase A
MTGSSHRWRLLLVPPRSGAENMARDAALMDRARETGEHIFSVYSWLRPTLSLGRNQTARNRYDLEEVNRRGIDVVRRPTGGRALLHWREVTYSVSAPSSDESLHESYERINRILLRGLAELGVSATESRGGERTPLPGDLPCFAAPAEGELIAGDGAKLVGSAQVRENGVLLQHGSILIHDDQTLISSLLIDHNASLQAPPAATLANALGREPSVDEVANALFHAVKSLEDPAATTIDESYLADLTARHLDHYSNSLWTWRR